MHLMYVISHIYYKYVGMYLRYIFHKLSTHSRYVHNVTQVRVCISAILFKRKYYRQVPDIFTCKDNKQYKHRSDISVFNCQFTNQTSNVMTRDDEEEEMHDRRTDLLLNCPQASVSSSRSLSSHGFPFKSRGNIVITQVTRLPRPLAIRSAADLFLIATAYEFQPVRVGFWFRENSRTSGVEYRERGSDFSVSLFSGYTLLPLPQFC